MFDMIAHFTRQAAFSRATFGPGPRTKGVIDHVKKELREVENIYEPGYTVLISKKTTRNGVEEIREAPHERQRHGAAAEEWTDVTILGIDGLTRAIWASKPEWTADQVAQQAVEFILAKQGKNEKRNWPDYRTAPADAAIEHVRGHED